MRPRSPSRRRPGRRAPRPEGLESRDLPSVAAIFFRAAALGHARASTASAGGPVTPAANPQPTSREQAREAFSAGFAGHYGTLPPRFTGQAETILILATGGSSAFLHGTLVMRFYPPTDPNGVVTGTATLFSRNVANTGSALALDLQGDPRAVDRAGRPTLLTWIVNGNSGGVFAGATGQGTVAIRYARGSSGRLHLHVPDAGHADVLFRGQVVVTGTGNDLFGS
jgi:hypothetical protein